MDGNQTDNSAAGSGAAYVFLICPTLGNMNCDCVINDLDIEPFVLALLDPAGYALAYPPPCDILNGDLQPDGNVDGGDAQGFVDLLSP